MARYPYEERMPAPWWASFRFWRRGGLQGILHVDRGFVVVGEDGVILLDRAAGIEVIRDRDRLHDVRRRLLDPSDAGEGSAPDVVQARLGLGDPSPETSRRRNRDRGRGVFCSRSHEAAVLVEMEPGQEPREWLLGTLHPEKLEAALRDAIADGKADLAARAGGEFRADEQERQVEQAAE